jgi:hypothetical protein
VAVVKETVWDEARGLPRSTVAVVDDSVYRKWKRAPEHVAFSVLGNGRARPGRVNGEDMRIVESIEKVRSIDWVTEAGAGGSIDFAESGTEDSDMGLENMTADEVREQFPDLFRAIREADDEDDADTGDATDRPADAADDEDDEAEGADAADADADDEAEGDEAEAGASASTGGAQAAAKVTEGAPEGYVSKAEFDELKRTLAERDMREAVAAGRERARQLLEEALRTSGLRREARDYVKGRFSEAAIGEGLTHADDASFKETVADEVRAMAKVFASIAGPSAVRGLGAPPPDEAGSELSLRESKEADIAKRLGAEQMPEKPKRPEDSATPAGAIEEAGAASIADRINARLN